MMLICFAAEAAKFCEAGLAAGGGIGRGWGIGGECGPRRREAAALAGEGVLASPVSPASVLAYCRGGGFVV